MAAMASEDLTVTCICAEWCDTCRDYRKGFYALAWGLHTHSKLSAWNDDPTRSHAEVLERFDLALARRTRPMPHAPRAAA